MAELIISVSGLRGIVGETLTAEVASRYAAAFAEIAPPGPIILGRDGRPSGQMLADAIHARLNALGRDTIDAGIVPTPTVGVLVRSCRAAGGIQITASHNPAPYNGMKLFSAEGRVIPATLGEKVLECYRAMGRFEGDSPVFAGAKTGTVPGSRSECDDPLAPHLRAVLAIVDVERIRRRQFSVLLDSNHGAGGPLGRRLLEALVCRTTVLGEEPNGQFAHTPEPTAENLACVVAAMSTSCGAGVPPAGSCGAGVPPVDGGRRDACTTRTPAPAFDVGFCQDPDADRLAVIDEAGHYIGEEYTVALCVEHVLRQRKGPVVTNCSSSRMSEDIAARHGVPLFRSAVGEANVVDCMLAHDAAFGGEGNGGPIDPRVVLVRDSFVGMALLLDAMAERQRTVRQLAAELPRYEIVKTKIALPRERIAAALDALERHFADAAGDRLDGLRLDWPGRWLLVRASNTEPIVRAIAEASTADEARALCDAAAAVLTRESSGSPIGY